MMRRIQSALSPSDPTFRANSAHNRGLARELREKQEAARHVRPDRPLSAPPALRLSCDPI